MAQQKSLISLDFVTGLTLFCVVRRLLDNMWYDYTTKEFVLEASVANQYIPMTESTLAETTFYVNLML